MTTYYVDVAVGNDINNGLAEGAGNAWASIAHAQTQHVAGDIIYVKASGTYNETVAAAIFGTRFNPITYIGYTTTPGDNGKVTWAATGTYCIFLNTNFSCGHVYRNFIMTGGTGSAVQGGGDYTTFVNCEFTNSQSGYAGSGSQAILIFCEGHGNTNYGFTGGIGTRYIACKAYNNGFQQINGNQISLYKCILYGHTNAAQPVLNLNGQGNRIIKTVIDGEGVARDGIDLGSSSINNFAIVDSVIQNTVDNAIETDFLTGMNYIEANCAFHNVGTGGIYSAMPWTDIVDVERVEADPLFTDDANGDYTPTEDSPLIGAGMTPGNMQTTSRYNTIGAYDRLGTNAPGAYEFFPAGGHGLYPWGSSIDFLYGP